MQALAESSTDKEHFKGAAWTLADCVSDLAREGLDLAALMEADK
ncbi:MAG: hypothetical protein ACJ0Q8_07965 [Candidatus Azotimanducaceae bacterium]